MREEFYFMSSCGNTHIHAVTWKPEGEIKAILQISHGMAEHILRYDEFAKYLSARGYLVVGHDHLGHGKSVSSADNYGYFKGQQGYKNGNEALIQDIHLLRERITKEYPPLPYFILGHSMGSTLLRQYRLIHGQGLQGVILSGMIAHKSSTALYTARFLSGLIGAFKGTHYRSKFLDGLALGKYTQVMKRQKATENWVTRDDEKLKEYMNDERCGFIFTTDGYTHLFGGMLRLNKEENSLQFPKTLPILMVSGTSDPVGDFESGIRKNYEHFITLGANNITLQLYPDARHEVLNEVNREEVYQDIDDWMENLIHNR